MSSNRINLFNCGDSYRLDITHCFDTELCSQCDKQRDRVLFVSTPQKELELSFCKVCGIDMMLESAEGIKNNVENVVNTLQEEIDEANAEVNELMIKLQEAKDKVKNLKKMKLKKQKILTVAQSNVETVLSLKRSLPDAEEEEYEDEDEVVEPSPKKQMYEVPQMLMSIDDIIQYVKDTGSSFRPSKRCGFLCQCQFCDVV